MKKNFTWIFVGVLSILAGVFALLNPLVASLAVEQFAGWLFLFVGIAQLMTMLNEAQVRSKFLAFLWAAIMIWSGITLLWHPLHGLLALTFVLGFSFLLSGIFKVMLAFQRRAVQNYWWGVLLSALLSIILGVLIFSDFYISVAGIFGFLLAFELINGGVGLIFTGFSKGGSK